MTDLNKLKAIEVKVGGKTYVVKTDLEGKAYEVFKAIGLRPPGKILENV